MINMCQCKCANDNIFQLAFRGYGAALLLAGGGKKKNFTILTKRKRG